MTVSETSLRNAISKIAKVTENQNISMNSNHLFLDVLALSKMKAFDNDEKFDSVIQTIVESFGEIAENPLIGENLERSLIDFKSLHKKSNYPTNPPHDDLRIVYSVKKEEIWIVAFGHRYIPDDFYERMRNSKRI